MNEHFVGAKWFKYGQNTFLAETQWSDYCIRRLGRKVKRSPFFFGKKEKQGGWGGMKLTFIKFLLNQALFLVPNFSYFREVLCNKRHIFRKHIRLALFYINEKRVVKILNCLIIAVTYGTYYVTGVILSAFHVLTHVILRATLFLTHYINEKTEVWGGKVSFPNHRTNTM